MKKYNIGIIGAGMYGKVLMRCFQKDERANIIWVNSASEGTTKSAAGGVRRQEVVNGLSRCGE